MPYWHDDIGATCFALMQRCDAFGDVMNSPKKYVVSKTLDTPTWRDTTTIFPSGISTTFELKSAKPYPSGVVGLHYAHTATGE